MVSFYSDPLEELHFNSPGRCHQGMSQKMYELNIVVKISLFNACPCFKKMDY